MAKVVQILKEKIGLRIWKSWNDKLRKIKDIGKFRGKTQEIIGNLTVSGVNWGKIEQNSWVKKKML